MLVMATLSFKLWQMDIPESTEDLKKIAVDLARIETQAYHFHLVSELADALPLLGGDDASEARWLNADGLELYASHSDWVEIVRKRMMVRNKLRKQKR